MLNNAVILAGGKSSRMGEDKALMPFGEYSTMTEYQYRRLKKIFKNVYISAKENKFDFEADIIVDKYQDSSPMVAIASIVEELDEDFFLISVDMPLLSREAIEQLLLTYKTKPNYDLYILESQNGVEPTAAIYTQELLVSIKKQLSNNIHQLNYLVKKSNIISIKWNILEEFINVNDKTQYKSAKKYKNVYNVL